MYCGEGSHKSNQYKCVSQLNAYMKTHSGDFKISRKEQLWPSIVTYAHHDKHLWSSKNLFAPTHTKQCFVALFDNPSTYPLNTTKSVQSSIKKKTCFRATGYSGFSSHRRPSLVAMAEPESPLLNWNWIDRNQDTQYILSVTLTNQHHRAI